MEVAEMSDALIDAVAGRLRAAAARRGAGAHLPGAALGIVTAEGLAWSDGLGYADIASRRRPDADTVYRVASISKTVTATAILQLRDAGRLRLDDPLVRHLPEFAAVRCEYG